MKRGIPNYSSQEKISASNNYEQIEKNKQTKKNKTKQNKQEAHEEIICLMRSNFCK